MQTNKKSWIDYIRFIAVFLVLDAHLISAGSCALSIPSVIAESNSVNLPIIPIETHKLWVLDTFFVNNFNTQTASVGVVLFLLLTGYLSVTSREKGTGRDFLIKRLIRLYPTLIFAIFLSGIVLFLHQGIGYSILNYASTALLIYPILEYSPTIGVVWVLCIEMLFYIILAHIKRINIKNIIILSLLVYLLILCQYESNSSLLAVLIYYLKFIPIILIGVTIKCCEKYSSKKKYLYIVLSSLLGWGAIKSCSYVIADESTYTHIETYVVALIIFFSCQILSRLRVLNKTPKFITFINNISFQIYLLQLNIGMAFMYYLKCNVTNNSYIIVLFSVGLIIIVSAFVYYFIEIPIHKKLGTLQKNI